MAIVSTHLAACAGALTWMTLEWNSRGKPSVLGIISGAIAGLGTITPASSYVLPWHGIVIGLLAGAACYWACTRLKLWLGYDDSLDVFGVHGVGGVVGTMLTGVFATAVISVGPDTPNGVGVAVAWSGIMTYLILKLVGFVTALRVAPEAEQMGLDITLHGESIHS